ncbi:MAG: hypothetical protein K0S74_1424 [Chlamydiales bacterium]|jgi:hypothetical protein|nr:hypothetical protein [Chlamydiales bacterium]
MNPITLGRHNPQDWDQRYQGYLGPSICPLSSYQKLFKDTITEPSRKVSDLLDLWLELGYKDKYSVLKYMIGPCYGICMSLARYYEKTTDSKLGIVIFKEDLAQKALLFSLYDIVRLKVESANYIVDNNRTYQKLYDYTNNFRRVTVLSGKNKRDFKNKISEFLLEKRQELIILRVWPYKRKRFFFSVKPHAMFLYFNSSQQNFCFYDTAVNALCSAKSATELTILFCNLIEKKHPHYLDSNIVWRWETKTLDSQSLG